MINFLGCFVERLGDGVMGCQFFLLDNVCRSFLSLVVWLKNWTIFFFFFASISFCFFVYE